MKNIFVSLVIASMISLSACTIHTKPTYQTVSMEEISIVHNNIIQPAKHKTYHYQCIPIKDKKSPQQ